MEMKLKIIETPDYILAVSDEKVSDVFPNYYWCIKDNEFYRFSEDVMCDVEKGDKPIIAYQPKTKDVPELDLPLLSEIVVEEDVEKLANEQWGNVHRTGVLGFIEGYKAATKIYSEEDLNGYLSFIEDNYHYHSDTWHDADTDEPIKRKGMLSAYIQSLKQPKTPKWFVAEMEEVSRLMTTDIVEKEGWVKVENSKYTYQRLKTTTINGKKYLVGTYLT